MEELGPVDYVVVSFPGSDFRGEIAPAIREQLDAGTVRIIDLVFITKDAEGETQAAEVVDLDPEVSAGLQRSGIEVTGLFSEEDLDIIADGLEPGSSAALLVWENVWAKKIAQAIREQGGEMLDFQRIPHAIVETARQWAIDHPEEGS